MGIITLPLELRSEELHTVSEVTCTRLLTYSNLSFTLFQSTFPFFFLLLRNATEAFLLFNIMGYYFLPFPHPSPTLCEIPPTRCHIAKSNPT